jgi:hypothetical protein
LSACGVRPHAKTSRRACRFSDLCRVRSFFHDIDFGGLFCGRRKSMLLATSIDRHLRDRTRTTAKTKYAPVVCFRNHVFATMFSQPCFRNHVFATMFSQPCFRRQFSEEQRATVGGMGSPMCRATHTATAAAALIVFQDGHADITDARVPRASDNDGPPHLSAYPIPIHQGSMPAPSTSFIPRGSSLRGHLAERSVE